MENFENISLPAEVVLSLKAMDITIPTEIQAQTIPIALQGFDILASSQTGSGKTLAYLLPIISALIDSDSRALILVPTRELAQQVRANLVKVVNKLPISNVVLIGGESFTKQFAQLKIPPRIVIGTPGRIIDHLGRGTLKLQDINLVVLDEMDRMLDMGMKEQLEQIDKYLQRQRQVLMFSATMPKHIIEVSKKYASNPKRITVGCATKAATQIKQDSVRVLDKEKFVELTKQLDSRTGSVIVFVKTKRGADTLARMLKSTEHKAEAIHGDLSQSKREWVIRLFRQNKYRVMVATDVAARGLDIPHTQHVINYDLPMCPEDYLHRIGRTGRAGAEGFALSFISPEDTAKWRAIDRLINHGEETARVEVRRSSGGRKPFFGDRNKAPGQYSYQGSERKPAQGRRQGLSVNAGGLFGRRSSADATPKAGQGSGQGNNYTNNYSWNNKKSSSTGSSRFR